MLYNNYQRHCSRAMVGESGLETCWRRSLEGLPGLRQETLGSLDLCRWPQAASHGGSEKSGNLEVGGDSRNSTGFGALEEGLISSWGRKLRVPLISDSDPWGNHKGLRAEAHSIMSGVVYNGMTWMGSYNQKNTLTFTLHRCSSIMTHHVYAHQFLGKVQRG